MGASRIWCEPVQEWAVRFLTRMACRIELYRHRVRVILESVRHGAALQSLGALQA